MILNRIMRKKMNKILFLFNKGLSIILLLIISYTVVSADEFTGKLKFNNELKSILTNFKNYKYSKVDIWQMETKSKNQIKELIEIDQGFKKPVEIDPKVIESADKAILDIIESGVRAGDSKMAILRQIRNTGKTPPGDFDQLYNYYDSKLNAPTSTFNDAYVVTTEINDELIVLGLIINVNENLNEYDPSSQLGSGGNVVYTKIEMEELVFADVKGFDASTLSRSNLLDQIEMYFEQGQVTDVTPSAKGITGEIDFYPDKYGVSNSLTESNSEITNKDIQKFKRISEAEPSDVTNNNMITLGPDLFSFKSYNSNNLKNDSIVNEFLPSWGLEVKYGNEAINYPSFWSERITASYLFDNAKIGLILPSSGWASISEEFEIDRKLTHGGIGLATEIDFPSMIISESAVFNFKFAYVFGDAVESEYKNISFDANNYDILLAQQNSDYLVRFNSQLHYTFGIAVDDDYWLRFGLGGTIYSMENWYYTKKMNDLGIEKINYTMDNAETVGGMSVKIDFMAKGLNTPIGASIQYFDSGIYTNLWIQMNVIDNVFSLAFDAKGYYKIFPDDIRAWENESVFIPSIRAIIHF